MATWLRVEQSNKVADFTSTPTVGGSTIWHSGNDGSGSGLDADTLDGYQLSTSRDAANTVPVRDGNGYLNLGWINTTSGEHTGSITKIYASPDDYIRYITPATFRSQVTDGYYLGASSKAADSNLLDGIDSSQFLRSDTGDTASGDITFTGGAYAIYLDSSSDIRSSSGSWTGEYSGKLQYHSDLWYLQSYSGWRFRNSSAVDVTTIDSSGNFTASGNVTAYSDIKLKKDIVTIDNALDKINAMRGVYYTEIETDRARTGVIAQEVEKVLPEVVLDIEGYNPNTGETDTTKAVDYGNMVGLLIEAIKEQQQQIDELKAKLEA